MTRDVLTQVLKAIDAVEVETSSFRVAEERQLHLYLGELGQAMVVRSVRGGRFHDDFLELTVGEREESLFVEYASVSAASAGGSGKKGRTGFA